MASRGLDTERPGVSSAQLLRDRGAVEPDILPRDQPIGELEDVQDAECDLSAVPREAEEHPRGSPGHDILHDAEVVAVVAVLQRFVFRPEGLRKLLIEGARGRLASLWADWEPDDIVFDVVRVNGDGTVDIAGTLGLQMSANQLIHLRPVHPAPPIAHYMGLEYRKGMTVPSQDARSIFAKGRVNQKRRTMDAIVGAATALVSEGRVPTVEEAAARAMVSRTTAYRYFPTQTSLLLGVSSQIVGGTDLPWVEVSELQGLDPADAIALLVRRAAEWAFDNEQVLRMILRLSLDRAVADGGFRRPGYRAKWIQVLLEPVRGQLDGETYDRLSSALTLLIGSDPLVCLTDVAGLDRTRAIDTLEWAARALMRAAAPRGDKRAKPRRPNGGRRTRTS